MSKEKKDVQFSIVPKVVNGAIAGVVGVSIVFPLDLVKTRLQNQSAGPNGELQYKNMFDCFKKTYKAEGYFGMYKGSAVNIILVAPEKAIKLSVNDFFRYHFTKPDGKLPIPRQMLAGGLAGILQMVITTPMELLKIQMQDAGRVAAQAKAEGRTIEKITALGVATRLVKEKGIFGLYKGLGANIARDVTFSAIYFPLFATINDFGPRRDDGTGEAAIYWNLIAGLIAGATSAFLVTPCDVVKTRLQLLTKGSRDKTYNGMGHAYVSILKDEGVTAFFKGALCRMIVIAPLFGITQMFYFLGIAEYLLGYEMKKI